MDAAVTRVGKEGKSFRVNYCCPWCGTNGNPLTSYGAAIARGDFSFLVVCPGPSCLQPAMVTVHVWDNFGVEQLDVMGVYPSPKVAYDDPGVPEIVRRDFEEALNCRQAGFFLGAATTARRALQTALIEKGANENDKLVNQINALDDETLPRKLKLAAHQVRLIGNDAAHPGEVQQLLHVGNLSVADVDALLRFAEQVFHMLYVLPHELEQAQAKRPLNPRSAPKPASSATVPAVAKATPKGK